MPVAIHAIKMTGQKTINVFRFNINEPQRYYLLLKDCNTLFRKEYANEDLSLYLKIEAYEQEDGPLIPAQPIE